MGNHLDYHSLDKIRTGHREEQSRPQTSKTGHYQGNALPPAPAIERQMEQLGVSPNQKERARQTFMKSAQYAEFIDASTGRFVKPGIPLKAEWIGQPERREEERLGGSGGGDGGDGPEIDPIIRGLLARLPKSGEVWPDGERKLWLQLLEGSFKLIYKDKNEAAN
jgi:hypothetical protein